MANLFSGLSDIADDIRKGLAGSMDAVYEHAGRDSRAPEVTPRPAAMPNYGPAPRMRSDGMDPFPAWGAQPADRRLGDAPAWGAGSARDELLPNPRGRSSPADMHNLYDYYSQGADAARARVAALKAQAESGGGDDYNWSGGGNAEGARGLEGVQQWIPMLQKAASEYGVPWQALAAIMGIESGGDPGSRSVAGAMGLMQVMPMHFGSGDDPMDPWTNIRTGAKVFADGYKRYGSLDKAAAAYLGAIDANGNITDAADAYGTTGTLYVQLFNNNLAALNFGSSQPTGSTGNARIDKAIEAAYGTLGTPYVWGGESWAEGGFDCSGLIQYAYANAGVALPRTAQEQYHATQRIDRSQLRNGDLIFYTNTYQSNLTVTHVGMYVNGKVLNAVKEGDVVRWIEMSDPWWNAHIYGYGRVPLGGDFGPEHVGVDAPAPAGSSVNAVRAGQVIGTGADERLGNYAVIFDGLRFYTYGHIADLSARDGDWLERGDALGTTGSTGLTTGPHTHLEVHDLSGNDEDAFGYL